MSGTLGELEVLRGKFGGGCEGLGGVKLSGKTPVLAEHNGLWYRATVKSVHNHPDTDLVSSVAVHYDGWHNKWDESLPLRRVLPVTQETKRFQELVEENDTAGDLQPAAAAYANKDTVAVDKDGTRPLKLLSGGITNTGVGSGAAAGREGDLGPAGTDTNPILRHPHIRIYLPGVLKDRLLVDWEMTSLRHRILDAPVPETKNIIHLLSAFQAAHPGEELGAVCDGVELYFNRVLGLFLLYPPERALYHRMMLEFQGKTACEVYGAIHLLRLLVKLPELFVQTPLARNAAKDLERGLALLSRFMVIHAEEYFEKDYKEMPMDYIEDATADVGVSVEEM